MTSSFIVKKVTIWLVTFLTIKLFEELGPDFRIHIPEIWAQFFFKLQECEFRVQALVMNLIFEWDA